MVQLIKIDRLGPRIEGMLYRKKFDETWSLLDDVSGRVFRPWVDTDDMFRVLVNYRKLATLCYTPNISKSC